MTLTRHDVTTTSQRPNTITVTRYNNNNNNYYYYYYYTY